MRQIEVLSATIREPAAGEDTRTSRMQDEATLAGVRLAARTLEHHLANHLALTVGYAELIAEDAELPERLRDMAQQVLVSARAAIESVRSLRRVNSIKLVDDHFAGGPLMELEPRSPQ